MKEKNFTRRLVQDATIFLIDRGVESGFEIPQYTIVTSEINNVNDQTKDSSFFYEKDVTECFCKIGCVTYPEDGITINCGANNYNAEDKESVKFNRNYNGLLESIKPFIINRKFKSNYRVYIFVTRYQRDHIGAPATQFQICSWCC